MTKTELEGYRSTLLAMRARLNGDVRRRADEQADGPAEAPADPTDLGADSYGLEFSLSLLHNQEQVLEEIGEALDRLQRGAFGRCEECAGPIAKARLQAVPYARHCVACARKLQQRS
jgi:RNA polymerase-binding protein DksA